MNTQTQIDFYGDKDNYIHLKFGDVRKMYYFTPDFVKKYPTFTSEYEKYFDGHKDAKFKNPFQIVAYVYKNEIPVHFYYNFTETPAKGFDEIMEYLAREHSFISNIE